MAEGAAVVMVEELEHARRARREDLLRGGSATAPPTTPTTSPLPIPSRCGVIEMMRAALERSGVAPDEIDYINAHGTSTPYNDVGRDAGDQDRVRRPRLRLAVSSNKSMIGHLFGAAGAIEALATVLTIHHGVIPPTINYRTPDPECDLDYVPNEAREADVRHRALELDGPGRPQRLPDPEAVRGLICAARLVVTAA